MKQLRSWATASVRGTAVCAAVLLGAQAQAQVEVSLVAAQTSVQPGHPIAVALRLQHAPHWHSYWINPGIGFPTSLAWHLPTEFEAGAIQWPTPQLIKSPSGEVTGNGYEGDVLLMVTLTPSASLKPGKPVTLAAKAKWLMCERECIPGQADVSLTLPVTAAAPQADPQWAEKFRQTTAELPRALAAWSAAATRAGDVVTLTIKPVQAGGPAHRHLHFFPEDKFIGFELPQEIRDSADGGFVITLHKSTEGAPKAPARLVGVLSSDDAWGADGAMRGLRIDTAL